MIQKIKDFFVKAGRRIAAGLGTTAVIVTLTIIAMNDSSMTFQRTSVIRDSACSTGVNGDDSCFFVYDTTIDTLTITRSEALEFLTVDEYNDMKDSADSDMVDSLYNLYKNHKVTIDRHGNYYVADKFNGPDTFLHLVGNDTIDVDFVGDEFQIKPDWGEINPIRIDSGSAVFQDYVNWFIINKLIHNGNATKTVEFINWQLDCPVEYHRKLHRPKLVGSNYIPLYDITGDVISFIIPKGSFLDPEFGSTYIYRSTMYVPTSFQDSSYGSNNLNISGNTATFDSDLADSIGIGYGIFYDTDGDATLDTCAFFSYRNSATSWTIQAADGGTPVAVTNKLNWAIYVAYDRLGKLENGDENNNIPDEVEEFEIFASTNDLVSGDYIWNAVCYAKGTAGDNTTPNFWAWTTGDTNYLHIFAPKGDTMVGTSQRHEGTFTNTKYYLVGNTLTIPAYARVDGLQFYRATDAITTFILSSDFTDADLRVSNCIMRGSSTTASNRVRGIYFYNLNNAGVTFRIWNNIFYNFGTNAGTAGILNITSSGCKGYIYNNTLWNTKGMQTSSTGVKVINNAIGWPSGAGGSGAHDTTASVTNAQGGWANWPGTSHIHMPGSGAAQFFESTSDFHLDTTATEADTLWLRGTDLSEDDSLPVLYDIDGDLRTNRIYDIGADQARLGCVIVFDTTDTRRDTTYDSTCLSLDTLQIKYSDSSQVDSIGCDEDTTVNYFAVFNQDFFIDTILATIDTTVVGGDSIQLTISACPPNDTTARDTFYVAPLVAVEGKMPFSKTIFNDNDNIGFSKSSFGKSSGKDSDVWGE